MAKAQQIADWIKERVEEAGAEGIVLGLSGGIDSAVTAILAQMAVSENVLGIIMPCRSVSQDADDALLLAEEFNIKTEHMDLTSPFDTLQEMLPEGTQLADANLKPRLRMTTLYYFANLKNYLVSGTGNKTELVIGYFTKYGDGGCDMLPLGGLLKVEVRELARELGVPEPIITKPPSAGLWEGQTDEGETGISYEELDRIIGKMDKGDFTPQTKTEEKVLAMKNRSEHKKCCPPIFKIV